MDENTDAATSIQTFQTNLNKALRDREQKGFEKGFDEGYEIGMKDGIKEGLKQASELLFLPSESKEPALHPRPFHSQGGENQDETSNPTAEKNGSDRIEETAMEYPGILGEIAPKMTESTGLNNTAGSDSQRKASSKKAGPSQKRPATIEVRHKGLGHREPKVLRTSSPTSAVIIASARGKAALEQPIRTSTATVTPPPQAESLSSRYDPIDTIGNLPPYQKHGSAEFGEACFMHLQQQVLTKIQGGSRRSGGFQVSEEAKKIFGSRAQNVVRTHEFIQRSGVLFSESWKEGIFVHGSCDPLPKEELLLLLQEYSFASSEINVLRNVLDKLQVYGLFHKVVAKWYQSGYIGLGDFPIFESKQKQRDMIQILSVLTSASCTSKKQSYYLLCILFVTRSYKCLDILNDKFKLEGTLRTKVFQCLRILHDAIQKMSGQATDQELAQSKSKDRSNQNSAARHFKP